MIEKELDPATGWKFLEGLIVRESNGKQTGKNLIQTEHYQGVIKADPGSLVAFAVLKTM